MFWGALVAALGWFGVAGPLLRWGAGSWAWPVDQSRQVLALLHARVDQERERSAASGLHVRMQWRRQCGRARGVTPGPRVGPAPEIERQPRRSEAVRAVLLLASCGGERR